MRSNETPYANSTAFRTWTPSRITSGPTPSPARRTILSAIAAAMRTTRLKVCPEAGSSIGARAEPTSFVEREGLRAPDSPPGQAHDLGAIAAVVGGTADLRVRRGRGERRPR